LQCKGFRAHDALWEPLAYDPPQTLCSVGHPRCTTNNLHHVGGPGKNVTSISFLPKKGPGRCRESLFFRGAFSTNATPAKNNGWEQRFEIFRQRPAAEQEESAGSNFHQSWVFSTVAFVFRCWQGTDLGNEKRDDTRASKGSAIIKSGPLGFAKYFSETGGRRSGKRKSACPNLKGRKPPFRNLGGRAGESEQAGFQVIGGSWGDGSQRPGLRNPTKPFRVCWPVYGSRHARFWTQILCAGTKVSTAQRLLAVPVAPKQISFWLILTSRAFFPGERFGDLDGWIQKFQAGKWGTREHFGGRPLFGGILQFLGGWALAAHWTVTRRDFPTPSVQTKQGEILAFRMGAGRQRPEKMSLLMGVFASAAIERRLGGGP